MFSVDYKNLSRHLMHTNRLEKYKPYYKAIYNTPLPSHNIISAHTGREREFVFSSEHRLYRVNVHIVFIIIVIIIILPRHKHRERVSEYCCCWWCVFFFVRSVCSLSSRSFFIRSYNFATTNAMVLCGNAAMCTLESLCVLCIEL